MRKRMVTLPELALIAGTRVALGAGVGLLLGERLDSKQRRAAGIALLAVGVLTTFPLAAEVLFRRESHEEEPAAEKEEAGTWLPRSEPVAS